MNIDFIIIGSRDWDNNWQTQHRLAKELSKNYRVLYIENTGLRSVKIGDFPRILQRIKNWKKSIRGFRKINENLTVLSPLIFPFPYIKIFQVLNSIMINRLFNSWIKKNNFSQINLISFLATPLVQDIINKFNFLVKIYYIGDNHLVAAKNQKFVNSEKNISKNADAVFSTSEKLREKFVELNSNTFKFPAGVELEKFEIDNKDKNIPKKLRNVPKPLIGFIGSMNEKIDLELMEYSLKQLPNYSFVFIGENSENRMNMKIFKNKNIFFLGKQKHSELKNYLKNIDCAIIPYNVNNFTDTVYPSKLNEYLALGLPIVSTNFYEIKFFNRENNNVVNIALDKIEFVNLIKETINKNSETKQNERKEVAKKNSWKIRYEKIIDIILKINHRKKVQKIEWEKSFKEEYKAIVRKIKFSLMTLISIIFIFLVSPLPYYAGNVLKVKDDPAKVDVIIGLSGYGQSSYINNSYQQIALDVYYYYKLGYADLIYLSGRKQVFEEFELMKNILISFGVPASKIYINKTISTSTYNEMININNFLKEQNLSSANIITSSLHQFRAKLLFKKINKNISVNFIPTTNFEDERKKWFYSLDKQRVIFYEYLSIVYNLIKTNVSK